jgi:DNA-directed RNA polymerase subunit L
MSGIGNIKVARVDLIDKVRAVKDKAQSVLDAAEATKVTLTKAAEDATGRIRTIVADTIVANPEALEVSTGFYRGRLSISLDDDVVNTDTLKKASQETLDALAALTAHEITVREAEEAVRSSSRDLALLEASSSVDINVKTQGFIGYFS